MIVHVYIFYIIIYHYTSCYFIIPYQMHFPVIQFWEALLICFLSQSSLRFNWDPHPRNHLWWMDGSFLVFVNFTWFHHINDITGKHLVLPALVGGHLRMCWKRGKKWEFFTSWLTSCCIYSKGTCASLLHIIIIIKPFLKIFNECRSLTGVGELNPYWRSSMNVEVERGWEN